MKENGVDTGGKQKNKKAKSGAIFCPLCNRGTLSVRVLEISLQTGANTQKKKLNQELSFEHCATGEHINSSRISNLKGNV